MSTGSRPQSPSQSQSQSQYPSPASSPIPTISLATEEGTVPPHHQQQQQHHHHHHHRHNRTEAEAEAEAETGTETGTRTETPHVPRDSSDTHLHPSSSTAHSNRDSVPNTETDTDRDTGINSNNTPMAPMDQSHGTQEQYPYPPTIRANNNTTTTTDNNDSNDNDNMVPLQPVHDGIQKPTEETSDAEDATQRADHGDTSFLVHPPQDDVDQNQTNLEEGEMGRKLMDMESSFLPETSAIQVPGNEAEGVDDTYLFGVPVEESRGGHRGEDRDGDGDGNGRVEVVVEEVEEGEGSIGAMDNSQISFVSMGDGENHDDTGQQHHHEEETVQQEEQAPRSVQNEDSADVEETPTAPTEQGEGSSSLLEVATSSPTAAAATRQAQRNDTSNSPVDPNTDNQSHQEQPEQPEDNSSQYRTDTLPPMPETVRHSTRSLSPGQLSQSRESNAVASGDSTPVSSTNMSRRRVRPKYLVARSSAHRLSSSSITSSNTEMTNSEATLGADFALQSGGAAPGNDSSSQKQGTNDLARSVSLGSLASGISGYSEENIFKERNVSASGERENGGGLQTLTEEEQSRPGTSEQKQSADYSRPMTPKENPPEQPNMLTDTALGNHGRDVQVPTAFARQYREDFGERGMSPGKRAGAPTPGLTRSGRTMTLKEQSSTIDRLSKENFDLKMRIHFLNEALDKRSEEGVKEMVSENVELKSDKLKLQKDNQHMRRRVRDMEKQLQDKESDKESMINHDPDASEDDDRETRQRGEEVVFLRERIDAYEMEIEKMRSESLAKESEKRRLAEVVKSLSEGRAIGSDLGAREERDMWKDMLEAETAAREQAEEESKRLRDELLRSRNDMHPAALGSRSMMESSLSYSMHSDRDASRHRTLGSSAGSTLVDLELLKQENAELRKEVSAQTSMLTSRNREKERLYQDIEELKLGQRRDGVRSIAGDSSILDRSASRAYVRPSSRGSDGTRTSRTSDIEREGLETRNLQLRDQVATLKVENQAIQSKLDGWAQEMEARDKTYQDDVDQAEEEIQGLREEIQSLKQELEEAWQGVDEREAAFEDLRTDAQEEIDGLVEEYDQKADECQRYVEALRSRDEKLRSQDEDLQALQAEVRAASEGILRLEEDAQNNLGRYKAVQQELENANGDIESLEKNLFEANAKVQRLTVQIESGENEIAFLREEQDADKIRITDIESELKTCQMSLYSEREKTRELEMCLAEERHQREVVGSREKQEIQRIINELNRESSAAKEEGRKLKKALSAQEIETTTWRERLMDLENNLRVTLGDLDGSRSSLISNIVKLQKELESTALGLESTRTKLDDNESLLRNRDALLESHGLESRKLAELLDRERQARRADKQSFEQALKSHNQASRTITQTNSRISELEGARIQDRRRYSNLEQQYKDQLSERNSMFLTIWKRLSAMCGPDWAHSHSLINGNLPSQEVIGNILFWPGFSKHLLLAVKAVENLIHGFKNSVKAVERDLTKKYQALEQTFGVRIRKQDRMEEAMRNMRAQQQQTRGNTSASPEMASLRRENRLLKAEINLRSRSSPTAIAPRSSTTRNNHLSVETEMNPDASPLVHQNSASAIDKSARSPHHFARSERNGLTRSSTQIPQPTPFSSSTTLANNGESRPGDQKWVYRLHELEKRLKAEREARLSDRSGARRRLEERDAENEKLRGQLERERVRMETATESSVDGDGGGRTPILASGSGSGSGSGRGRGGGDGGGSSSEEEGICVDIEV